MSDETSAERRVRRRAMRAGLTDDQLAHLEDEEHAETVAKLGMRDWLARQPPGKLRKVPIGRPRGDSVLTMQVLEARVDAMRRNRLKLSQRALADEVPCARSTLQTFLNNHPGAWAALRARYATPR